MPGKHEPDPAFMDHLEWQLGRELRRGVGTRPRFRVMKTAALVGVSVLLGAAAMEGSRQFQDTWRRELAEVRLKVQQELAQKQLQARRDAALATRGPVERGLVGDMDLVYLELEVAKAEAEVRTVELDLEEMRTAQREPQREIWAPLVEGRDFVTERLQVRVNVAARRLEVARQEGDRTRQRVVMGVVRERAADEGEIVAREAETELQAATRQMAVRRDFLDSRITAVEAELRSLEIEAAARVLVLDQRLQYLRQTFGTFERAIDAGTMKPVVASELQTRIAEAEAELRLAQAEQEIVRKELDRRTAGT